MLIYRIQQNIRGGKPLRFLQFFTQSRMFSHELWPCRLPMQVYKHVTMKVFPQMEICNLTVEVFQLKSFAIYGINTSSYAYYKIPC